LPQRTGKETEILQGNQELVDAELVRVMVREADKMAENGNQNADAGLMPMI